MADLKISQLPVLDGGDLDATDELAVADRSASETRRIRAKGFFEAGVGRVIDDGMIPGAKLVPDTVTTKEIGPGAVTAAELASGAVVTVAIQDGASTDAKVANGINGAKLADDTVAASKVPASSLDRGLDKVSGAIGHTNVVAAATVSGISYDAQGHITAVATLAPSDLPVATSVDLGGVIVPADSGLTVSGVGALDHANNVTAGKVSGITYVELGHIFTAVPLAAGDIPIATETTVGGVSVPTGSALTVSAAGDIAHEDSPVAIGTYTKVTVNKKGHVTSGTVLAASDVPDLDAAKISSGVLAPSLFGKAQITRDMLADYAVAYIQELTPGLTGNHAGTLWFQESIAQLSMWNGNSWFPIGQARLTAENLRYCGTINAATGLITGVTSFGTAAGYKIGDALKTAVEQLTGVYFVVDTPGSNISMVTSVAFDAGDWVLCNGAVSGTGYVRIDTLNGSGGGGGGSISKLDDLLDVQLGAPSAGDFLQMNSSGAWINSSSLDEGTYA